MTSRTTPTCRTARNSLASSRRFIPAPSTFVQAGFMPEALSTGPAPYRHGFPSTGVHGVTTGWAWPPKDYERWAGLIEAWARHAVERYGMARVVAWPWEIWNEPDGLYWRGT